MAYLLSGDLDTHIYAENKDEIVRMDNDIINKAITAAVSKAKKYLSRFDLVKVFGTEDIPPVVDDEDLKNMVKAIAVWQIVLLGTPNIDLAKARTNYEDAINSLLDIQKGRAVPDWPLKADDPATDYVEDKRVQWNSNPKRDNFY